MTIMRMNYLAILIAAVAAWIFGAVYYGVLGSVWMSAAGVTAGGAMPLGPMITSFIAELVMAWALSGMVGRLGAAQVTVHNALIYAVTSWLGFAMTSMFVNNAFAGRPLLLTLIDGGHWLGVAVIMGLVVGKMGVRREASTT
jgi:hypothetical protein